MSTPVTRCKFKCDAVEKVVDGSGGFVFNAKMTTVYGDSPENKEFWKWTPTGRFEVSCVKHDRFEPGKEYYIDIIPASPPLAAVS